MVTFTEVLNRYLFARESYYNYTAANDMTSSFNEEEYQNLKDRLTKCAEELDATLKIVYICPICEVEHNTKEGAVNCCSGEE